MNIRFALTNSLVVILFAAVSDPIRSESSSAAIKTGSGEFRYIFWETTGQRQYVLIGKSALPIGFDRKRSNRQALDSLDVLRWEVLYPNSDGGIVLVGELCTEPVALPTWDKIANTADPPGSVRYTLALRRWYVAAPFGTIVLNDPSRPDSPRRIVKRRNLERKDFDSEWAQASDFDWKSPAFDPSHYVKHISLRSISKRSYTLAHKGLPKVQIERSAHFK